jgi:hypothetical protein
MSDHHAPLTVDAAFEGLLQQVHVLGREVLWVHTADDYCQPHFPHEAIDSRKLIKFLSAYVPKKPGGTRLDITQSA